MHRMLESLANALFVVAALLAGFFKQFGGIKRLRIARNRKVCVVLNMQSISIKKNLVSLNIMVSRCFQTGKSKHYGFIEFESPFVSTFF